MDRYSDGRYVEANPDWHDSDASWKAARVAALLDSAGLRPSTICDVGCGSGGVLAELRRRLAGSRMVGLDVSPQAVEIAQARHPELDIRLGDLASHQEYFDVVLVLDVFEHVEDYLGLLRAMRTYGEHFIFHIPLDMSAQLVVRAKPLLAKREEVGHLHYFSKDTALATLTTAGYAVDRWSYTAGSIDAPDRTRRMKLLALPRRVGAAIAPNATATVLGGFSLLVLAHPQL